MDTVKLPFYARLALTLLSVVLIFLILYEASGIFIPLVFALLIAILLFPLSRFLEQRLHMGRATAAITPVILFISAMTAFIYFLALQVATFSSDLPDLRKRFQYMFGDLQHWLSYKLHINTHQQTDYINRSINNIAESAVQSARNILLSVTGVMLTMVFVLIFTFFILYHRKLLMKFVLRLFSNEHRTKVTEVVMETKTMINAYILGLVIEMLLLSIVTSILFLVLGIKYAILLGVMSAVLNVIPYLGIYTAIVIGMLVTFANSTGNAALTVGISLLTIHLLDSNILFPRIIGGRVKMNPFITILAVITGEYLWGIPGMFLFIPIAGIIKLVCERVEGLEAWALLIGVEETEEAVKKIKADK